MLLDTSGLFCYFHQDESRHQSALTYFEAAGNKLTHSYVIAEFVALAHARKLSRSAALGFIQALLLHPEVEIVWVDEMLNQQALSLLEARLDKDYSLCDAISFLLMKERGLVDALTTDHHFEQEGLRKLL